MKTKPTKMPTFKFALNEDFADDKQFKSFLPTKGEPLATGYDVRAALKEPLILKPFEYAKIPLGFRAFCPKGWWFELRPRSSTLVKRNLHALYGVVDENFEGQCIFACQYLPQLNIGPKKDITMSELTRWIFNPFLKELFSEWVMKYPYPENLTINPGDAIGQIVPVERQEMKVVGISNEEYDKLCSKRNGKRGAAGFGSTDEKK